MKIRAITLGQKLNLNNGKLDKLRSNLEKIKDMKSQFENCGIEVQYVRFASEPFNSTTSLDKSSIFGQKEDILNILDNFVDEGLLGIYSFCPGLCDQQSRLTNSQKNLLSELPELLKKHPNMFSSIQVASNKNGFNFQAIKICTKIIKNLSNPDPFKNVQFAVTFNVPPNTPFFPSAYHVGEVPKISIALEAADEVTKILKKFPTQNNRLSKIRNEIKNEFTSIYDRIAEIIIPFCETNRIIFEGMDFSPAPYPTKEKSIGTALEEVGICKFGEFGSVFSVGFLTQALQSVDRPKIGFSGFMQPLLEDYIIAKRNNENKVDINKLMLYSTMCGLGLDCIPIPGNIDYTTLQLLLMDLAMISLRLKKPLTARLMPIHDKEAGEITEFNFEYFTNSKICEVSKSNSKNLQKFNEKNYSFFF